MLPDVATADILSRPLREAARSAIEEAPAPRPEFGITLIITGDIAVDDETVVDILSLPRPRDSVES